MWVFYSNIFHIFLEWVYYYFKYENITNGTIICAYNIKKKIKN